MEEARILSLRGGGARFVMYVCVILPQSSLEEPLGTLVTSRKVNIQRREVNSRFAAWLRVLSCQMALTLLCGAFSP